MNSRNFIKYYIYVFAVGVMFLLCNFLFANNYIIFANEQIIIDLDSVTINEISIDYLPEIDLYELGIIENVPEYVNYSITSVYENLVIGDNDLIITLYITNPDYKFADDEDGIRNCTLHINKAKIDTTNFVFGNAYVECNGMPQSINVTNYDSDLLNINYDYYKLVGGEYSAVDNAIDVGYYKVVANFEVLNSNYDSVESMVAYLTITKGHIDISEYIELINGKIYTFDNLDKIIDLMPDSIPLGIENITSDNHNYHKNVGIYDYTLSFEVSDNFYEIDSVNCYFEIVPKELHASLIQDTFTYGEDVVLEIKCEDIVEGTIVNFTLDDYISTIAGDYEVGVSIDNSNYILSSNSLHYTIDKATIDMGEIAFEDITLDYDGEKHFSTLVGNLPDFIDYVITSNGNCIHAGEYTTICAFACFNSNYNTPESKYAKVTILPRKITASIVLCDNLIEDGKPKNITFQFDNTINGDVINYLVIYNHTPIVNAGEYECEITLNNCDDYELVGNNLFSFEIKKGYVFATNENVSIVANGVFERNANISIDILDNESIKPLINYGYTNITCFETMLENIDEDYIVCNVKLNSTTKSNKIKLYVLGVDGVLHNKSFSIDNNYLVVKLSNNENIVIVEMESSVKEYIVPIVIVCILSVFSVALIIYLYCVYKKYKKIG